MPVPSTEHEYDPTLPETFDCARGFHRSSSALPGRTQQFLRWLLGGNALPRYLRILMDSQDYITSVRNVVPGSSATGRRPPLHLDPPDHTPYRRAIDRALGAARVTAIEGATRRVARD